VPFQAIVIGKLAFVQVSPPLKMILVSEVGVYAAQVEAHVTIPGACAQGVDVEVPSDVSFPLAET
jgi:hypothetical protein